MFQHAIDIPFALETFDASDLPKDKLRKGAATQPR